MSETAKSLSVRTTGSVRQPYVPPEDPRGELIQPEIAAADIRPFQWTESHYHRAFEQGERMFHVPRGALFYLKQETQGWNPEPTKVYPWTEEEAIAVGLAQKDCPICGGDFGDKRFRVGRVTGIRVWVPHTCSCMFTRLFYRRSMNPAYVQINHRSVRLENLKDHASHLNGFPGDKLEKLIEHVRTKRRNCMLLTGGSGRGKTTLLCVLYRQALWDWAMNGWKTGNTTPAVWKIGAQALAEQNHAWSQRNNQNGEATFGATTPVPECTPNKVYAAIKAGYVPYLFLDELDKVKLDSEFQKRTFMELIDTIQGNGGVVIATANRDIPALKLKLGADFGQPIVRRLTGPRPNTEKPDKPDDPGMNGFHVDFDHGVFAEIPQTNAIPANTLGALKRQNASAPLTAPPKSPTNGNRAGVHQFDILSEDKRRRR